MKNKFLSSIFLTLVLLATVVFAASSMRFGNIDLTWGMVDDGAGTSEGATCLRYADGPRGSNSDPNDFNGGITIKYNDPTVQNENGNYTNWNQVRYGTQNRYWDPINWRYVYVCGDHNQTNFGKQSGIAFNGADAVSPRVDYGNMVPFSLGKMCHINKGVYAGNDFEMTVAELKISGVDCGPDAELVDHSGNPLGGTVDLTYTFTVELDETPNSGNVANCKYTSITPCADAIIPGSATGNHLYCKYADNVVVDYTVAIIGFSEVPTDEDGNELGCEGVAYNPALATPGIFISEENATNCKCVWAAITDYVPSAVEMNFFEASGAEESIVLRWQTAFETDNIGFNVYRSETLIREDAVQLNHELIASLVPPGSTFGADYEFIDNSALPYTTYFYWIEDVDVNGTITTHGPVRAEWVD